MRGLRYLLLLGCALIGQLHAASALRAADYGILPGTGDCGPALRSLLEKLRAGEEPCTLELEQGEYHFHMEGSPRHKLFISNHDQQDEHPVGLPLAGFRDLTIQGNGSRFIFHGRMLPILVQDCHGVTFNGIDVGYATPFSAEGRIVEQGENSTTLEMHPGSQWCVEDGRFHNAGEGWKSRVGVAIAFLPDGRMLPSGKAGDIIWDAPARQLSPTQVRFSIDSRPLGLKPGHVLVLRSYWRPAPAIFLLNATNTLLENVVIHDSMGMGILGQRSSNISIRGGGVIRRPGRYGTTGADATHFSNCRGHISVTGALFEGMMDDAINVHATSLGITQVISPTEIEVRYMHPQAYGLDVIQQGERVRFIHGATLENDPQQAYALSVTRLDDHHLRITLSAPLPPGIGVGDALENACWHPSVEFCHNRVCHNRARGALFTTPRRVRVEHNSFDWSSGSAILLAGDAQGWYESGACSGVIIRHNTFNHCLSSLFQFTDAIIAICPEVKEPEAQKTRYHKNIRIEHNLFRTHRVPLLSAISADELIFRDNEVIYDDAAPPLFGGEPYRIRHCGQVELQELITPAE